MISAPLPADRRAWLACVRAPESSSEAVACDDNGCRGSNLVRFHRANERTCRFGRMHLANEAGEPETTGNRQTKGKGYKTIVAVAPPLHAAVLAWQPVLSMRRGKNQATRH